MVVFEGVTRDAKEANKRTFGAFTDVL